MGGIVLAGGKSARMRRDKALVEVNGRRLIDYVIDSLREVTEPVIVVGGAPLIPGAVPDMFPGEGPLGGLLTGLRTLGPGKHLVLGCDMPFARPELLSSLVNHLDRFDAAVPRVDGELQTLCGAYRGECVAGLMRSYRAGNRSIVLALDELSWKAIPESLLKLVDPDLRSFVNINTPDDLASAELRFDA